MKLAIPILLLAVSAMAAEVSDQTFEKDVSQSKGIVIVIFTRPGCMSCDAFEGEVPDVENTINEKFLLLNTGKSQAAVDSEKIETIPTLIVYKDGKRVGSCGGGNHKDVIRRLRKIIEFSKTKKDSDAPIKEE